MLLTFFLRPAPAPTNRHFDKQEDQQMVVRTVKPASPQSGHPHKVKPIKERPRKKPKAKPVVQPKPRVLVQPSGDKQQWMQQAGISANDYAAVDYIITHESGWRPYITNAEGCVGLGQACPASKLYAICPDLNPVCQLKFFSGYATQRYGGWNLALQTWLSKRWW